MEIKRFAVLIVFCVERPSEEGKLFLHIISVIFSRKHLSFKFSGLLISSSNKAEEELVSSESIS